jgi:hypothetical protein
MAAKPFPWVLVGKIIAALIALSGGGVLVYMMETRQMHSTKHWVAAIALLATAELVRSIAYSYRPRKGNLPPKPPTKNS